MTDNELKELVASLAIGQNELRAAQTKIDEKLEHLDTDTKGSAYHQNTAAEAFFFQNLVKESRLGSLQFDDITKGMIKHRGKIQEEYALLMTNDNAVAIIEVKYTLHSKDLDKLDRKIDNFKKLYPIYQHHQLYGALAGFHLHDDLKRRAVERGYFVLQRSSEIIHSESRPLFKNKQPAISENKQISLQDYLQNEFLRNSKHEYINGYLFNMEDESENHHKISHNTLSALQRAVKETDSACQIYNEMHFKYGSKYFYPDVMVVSETEERHEQYKTAPVILVEVLAPETRKKDLTTKRFFYQNLHSVEEYVLIEQDKAEIQVRRRGEHWQSRYYYLGDNINLESIKVVLSVADIYHQVEVQEVAH